MGLFDTGASLTSTLGATTNAIGAISSGINSAVNFGNALKNIDSVESFAKSVRDFNLPSAGETIGDVLDAVSDFVDPKYDNDWRVRLSIAKWVSFRKSPVLQPLLDAGGLIFPYTPSINISSSAKYQPINTTHTNNTFYAYQHSDPGTISITAPMYVEDSTQGLYWIAMVHYLRSLTKMFTGSDPKAGNPPPVVFLNGYGNYVFKNIPVVVEQIKVDLDSKSDYISVNVVGSAAGAVQGVSEGIGGLAGAIGGLAGSVGGGLGSIVGQATSIVSSVAGGVSDVAGLLNSIGVGGQISGGVTHVPTKSQFSVTLRPVYSRSAVRTFSLDRFVSGGYLNNPYGWA